MRTAYLSETMHGVLAAHLAVEFATAALTLHDGRTLDLVTIGDFQNGTVTGQLFGADPDDEPAGFNPITVRDVELIPLDPRMMAPSELMDLGLVAPPAAE